MGKLVCQLVLQSLYACHACLLACLLACSEAVLVPHVRPSATEAVDALRGCAAHAVHD